MISLRTNQPRLLHEALLMQTPRYRYHGGNVTEWQQAARQQLALRLGLDVIPVCEAELEMEYERDERDFHEYRFTFQTEPGYRAAAHLLVPSGSVHPPVILCFQGHSTGMHISLGRPKYEKDIHSIKGDRDYALQALREGYAAFVLEQRAFGECGGTERGPACNLAGSTALILGRTLIGERVHDVMQSIALLESGIFPIDSTNISITGNSGGGTTCIYAAAMDPRIKACMPSCSFCGFLPSIGAQQHCLCNYIPGIAHDFDMGDMAAMVAPRAFVAINGKLDGTFPIHSAQEQLEIAKVVYRELACEDRCRLETGQEGHRYYAALAWPALKEALEA